MDRAYAEWEQGGIKLWDLKLRQEAFKIWNLNRLLCLHHDNNVSEFQGWYIKQIKNKKIVSDILRPQVDAWENYRQDHARSTPELRKLKDEIGDIKIVNGIRNDHNQPIKLRDIYKNLTIKKYNSRVRRTDGQSNLQLDLNLQGIFPRIARIVHHKGRNTFFRFFARCLPGINHQRKRCPLNECSLTFSDPYIHFFFNCKLSTKHCNEIVPIVNQLSIKKIHSWSLNAIDLNQISHHEKTFPTLMAIIMNQMWNIICYNLFETDKSNKPPPVMNTAIIRKELSETINIAKWKLLKYLDYQSRINNSNDDVKLKFEFNRNWQTNLQTRTKTRRPHKKKTKTRRRTHLSQHKCINHNSQSKLTSQKQNNQNQDKYHLTPTTTQF
ncbi:Non-LTR retroelement reverse transcriptase-like protein [Tieghemostelium lacteum]|uniref:Non-LTR retroelement reverse transcriptase-like protein n=1 Tax=Tieghemostelium lacteum TaxID=361077 RepID=A0A151Z6G5_TIELA|nr:Non-LTR retroelement reverse transcriptase-like protein [Tieghemostelium lacteum]|eukprot:KYQ89527.1 Non-LTR retroelement reverse transcriptase-like protein [Tieghemostelium lacteum]